MFYESNAIILSIGDYINEIMNLSQVEEDGKVYFKWYRGHADKRWDLIPKIQRNHTDSIEELIRKERYLTNDFQARASIFKPTALPISDFSNWLTLMQHYGLPTRLLDWSRSPLVALYFCVTDREHYGDDGCIWVLTPGKLNKSQKLEKPTQVDGKDYDNTYIYNMAHKTIYCAIYSAFRRWKFSSVSEAISPEDHKFDHRFDTLSDKIIACYPTQADSRVYNQFSAFTVHNPVKSVKRLTDICDESTLHCITIPYGAKKNLKLELAACGITESYIFPDMEHLAKEICSW